MAKSKPDNIDYKDLKLELDNLLSELQRDDLDIDEALKVYARGQEIIKVLEDYLKNAENSVTELKAKYSRA
jgi:exodeoxyribonuclease VII small subunit